jgi:hypothetical protein
VVLFNLRGALAVTIPRNRQLGPPGSRLLSFELEIWRLGAECCMFFMPCVHPSLLELTLKEGVSVEGLVA